MVIRIFVIAILILSVLSYFVPIDKLNKKEVTNDTALLTFNDSTMYTLTPASMNRVVKSEKVQRFKNRDVMHNGFLTMKAKDKEGKVITDTLISDVIIKSKNSFKFLKNVKFLRNDYLTLNTDELVYNPNTKIATNTLPFNGRYFNNYIEGEKIYLDLNNYHMKSKNTHFEIEVQREGK